MIENADAVSDGDRLGGCSCRRLGAYVVVVVGGSKDGVDVQSKRH